MKLLSTIASALISISAFSQDFIEYNNFTFSHNGEEIQMEDIEKMTKRYGVGVSTLKRAKKLVNICENEKERKKEVGKGVSATVVCLIATPLYGILTLAAIELNPRAAFPGALPGALTIASAVGIAAGPVYAYNFSRKDRCILLADKKFKTVAEKLNQAINESNQ